MAKNRNIFRLEEKKPANPFRVPEGYFENFNREVEHRILREEKGSEIPEKGKSLLLRQLTLAASFIGFLVMVYSGVRFLVSDRNNVSENIVNELTALEDHILTGDESMIYELYSQTRSEEAEVTGEEDIMEYLLLQGEDMDVLLAEL